MNPSARGWIKKLLKEETLVTSILRCQEEEFYDALRQNGFIYGSNIGIAKEVIKKGDLSGDEICKINLFLALFYTHRKFGSNLPALESIINFYSEINLEKRTFFQDILKTKSFYGQLEKIIHNRIQINDNIITKKFNYFVINALLFVDVLAYREYLKSQTLSSSYIKKLEASIEVIALSGLKAKVRRTKYDNSLIELFESSLRYQDNADISYEEALQFINTSQEKYYILDIACMATWGDRIIDIDEQKFLKQLGTDLNINIDSVALAIQSVNSFYTNNKESIALLSSKNIVKTFYDNSSGLVKKLISRNKKRLKKELEQSKELMVLLSKSTVKDLTKVEQKKVQEQLLDIFKSIPSLAIFILPGGGLLLPLFIKFIPKMLPSAFDDNRIEED